MNHSAKNQCHCEIRWFILGVEKKEREETKEKREARIKAMVDAKIKVLVTAKEEVKNTAQTKKATAKEKWKKASRMATIFTLRHRPLPAYMTAIKIGAKVVVTKVGTKIITKVGTKIITKELAKAGVKIGAKQTGKTFVKKIPAVGLAAGIVFGWCRMVQGDFWGAALEVGSGAAACIPVYGTVASFGIDAGLVAYDLAA